MKRLFIYFLMGIVPCFSMQKQEDITAFIHSSNQFAFTIYEALPKERNKMYSPFCLYSSIMMAYLGAEKQTAKELKSLLKLHIQKENIPKVYNHWFKNTFTAHSNCELFFANGLWIEKTTPILSKYSNTLINCFHTKPQLVSFHYAPEKMRETINDWIGKRTEFHIEDLLTKDDVTEDTKIILASGASFKSSWKKSFNEAHTIPSPFHTKKERVYVEMMHQVGTFPFYETTSLKAVALPFSCSYYLVVILAKNPLLELDLNVNTYQKILINLKEQIVDLKLPKFSINANYDLNGVLADLNITNSFGRLANFSAINGRLDLHLSSISHGSFLSIDEYGASTVASDADDISMDLIPSDVTFHAERPFSFFLCDSNTFSLFFLGKCIEPQRAKQ